MAMALSFGALLIGIVADRLRRFGIEPGVILGSAALIFVIAQLCLVLGLHVPTYVPWVIISAIGAATVLSYSILNQYFPKEIAGQANAALNVFHIGGAFILQEAIGL